MKVTITRGGGVAGVLRVTEVEADDVPLEGLAALRAVSPAGGRALPRPDELTYSVRVDGDEARFTDSTLPEEVRRLIAWADAHPERRDRIRPPG